MKKLLSTILSLLMLLTVTVPALAYDAPTSAASDSNTVATENQLQTMSLDDIKSCNLQNVGDTYVLMEDENGVLYVELTDHSEIISNVSRAGTVVNESASYTIWYKTLLGQTKSAVDLDATVTWVKDGTNSYIQNLHGEYTVNISSFSCEWDDSYKRATDLFHSLGVNITKGTKTGACYIMAALAPLDEPIMDLSFATS